MCISSRYACLFVSGTAFVAPRGINRQGWLYRIVPSASHHGITNLVGSYPDYGSNYNLSNPTVSVGSPQMLWGAPRVAADNTPTDFIQGIKSIMGGGDPSTQDGMAVHLYCANASMEKKAFANLDGEMLIIPAEGRLDIQTEMGKIMVKPGEIVVIQRGYKFKVSLPDGTSRGYIEEIWGSRFELPELGVIGTAGLADPRDFEHPVASFDIDQSEWEIVYKVAGQWYKTIQDHTPFDVVAWHGNYVPYKYDMVRFIHVGSLTKDHLDPSLFTVLTAKSKTPGTPLTDFAVLSARWDVATETLRTPMFHRNVAVEIIGSVGGAVSMDNILTEVGELYFQNSLLPHGPSWEDWQTASNAELKPVRIYKDLTVILFESSKMMLLSDYATRAGTPRKPIAREPWTSLKPLFLNHIDKVNADLCAEGLPALGSQGYKN
ncbi:Homogentisate 1,2-dioxygenase [Amylocystis lapponica]|nr:Homogentisate 1,2-dioxygenase [Amylocystis lapponica]